VIGLSVLNFAGSREALRLFFCSLWLCFLCSFSCLFALLVLGLIEYAVSKIDYCYCLFMIIDYCTMVFIG